MTARGVRWSCALVALALVGAAGAAGAVRPAAQRPAPGLPTGGPPVLYAAPPVVPQLQNRDQRFRAPYELSSGTERYVDGEYLYTDYLYDDGDTTYPSDFKRYGGNAGDLMEYRMSVRGKDLAVRLSLTTLLAPDSTIAVVAFDTDRNTSTGSSTLPRDPGLPFPGTDAVLTTWGTGAEWSTWSGTAWRSVRLRSMADLVANQITLTVPRGVARPSGKWSATLATGLYDRTTGGWLPPSKPGGSSVVNLGFRFDGRDPGAAPATGQLVALTTRSPTNYARVLDFDLLRGGGERDNAPQQGLIYRIMASRLTSAEYTTESTPGTYEKHRASEGKQMGPLGAQYLSRLQPYAVFVPKAYRPGRPTPVTLVLHGQDGDYTAINDAAFLKQFGEDSGRVLVSASGRGMRGWYMDEAEYDFFEAWNDVARRYSTDPLRTALVGTSMGGYGSYRIGLRYPHLFSRMVVIIPAIQLTVLPHGPSGNWLPGVNDNKTLTNQWVENGRNLPLFHVADSASESTFFPAQATQVVGPSVHGSRSYDSLGYRYVFRALAADHAIGLFLGAKGPEFPAFIGRHTVEQTPFHVTYRRTPSSDRPDLGLAPDGAYWVSHIQLRDAKTPGPAYAPGGSRLMPAGLVDAVSFGFGRTDPTSTMTPGAGVTVDGLPYVEQRRTWGAPGRVPPQNRIVIKATNVRSLTIDPVAARVSCDVKLDVTSDGPIKVTLLGCPA